MNETIRALGVFLLSCTLAAGSLLALCLLADRHYKARLAKEYAGIEASMRPEQVKARAELHGISNLPFFFYRVCKIYG